MKRREFLMATALGILGVEGCGENKNDIAMPDRLPQAVIDVKDSVVTINSKISPESPLVRRRGSGVYIDSSIITAGHVIAHGEPLDVSCGDLVVVGRNDYVSRVTGLQTLIDPNDQYPDLASLELRTLPTALPEPPIAAHAAAVGEAVFFVDYGDTADSNIRHDNPAIYGGKVLETRNMPEGGVLYSVVTGLKNYSDTPEDTITRPGGSGGALFNSRGEIVGITSHKGPYPKEKSEAEFGVALPNFPEILQITKAQGFSRLNMVPQRMRCQPPRRK